MLARTMRATRPTARTTHTSEKFRATYLYPSGSGLWLLCILYPADPLIAR